MKNTSRKPHIYKVTNFETGQYYIGSQCSGKTVGVNYFTSSTNKEFKDGFKTYGEEKYKIEIIKEFEDPDECVRAENYMISDHMQLKDGLCLNRACCCGGEKIFSRVGTHNPYSEETKHKMSIAKKGRIKISIEGTIFDSFVEAAKYYNVSKQTIKYWIKNKKHNATQTKGIRLSEEEIQKRRLAAPRKKISFQGEVFDSLSEAARYYNVATPMISYWVKNKKFNAFYIEK